MIPSPNSDKLYNILLDVAAVSSNDIWAVGRSTYAIPIGEDEEYHDLALLMHWDGAHWSLVPSAKPNTSDNRRNGVTTLPDGTAWVVGSQDQSAPLSHTTDLAFHQCVRQYGRACVRLGTSS